MKLEFWVGIGTLGEGDFNTNLKQKNDSDCNFYNFSLLVPYPNKFVLVCIYIVIFYGIYYPLPTNTFFVGG